MIDGYNRKIDYLRISITDKCNLRCKYCIADDDLFFNEDVLSFDEIIKFINIFTSLGVRKIKITGGEPFIRPDIIEILKGIRENKKVKSLTITTNGTLLHKYMDDLHKLKIDCVNVSLDSINETTYKNLTGKNQLNLVTSNIKNLVSNGIKTKVNCVPIKNVNDNEIIDISLLAQDYPIDVRFIELMPTSQNKNFTYIKNDEILEILKTEYPDLRATDEIRGNGPAIHYKSENLIGKIGFISALSNHFCNKCNRLRLTSEGFLKLCIFHDIGLNIKDLFLQNYSDDEVKNEIINLIKHKPEKHEFLEDEDGIKHMSKIGG